MIPYPFHPPSDGRMIPFYVTIAKLGDSSRAGQRFVFDDRIVWALQDHAPVTETAVASFNDLSEAEQIAMLIGFNIHWPLEAVRRNPEAALGPLYRGFATADIIPAALQEPARLRA